MTAQTSARHVAPQRRARRTARSRWTWQQVVVAVVLMAGVGILLYPTAADWFAARVHATEVSGYVDYTDALPDEARERMLEAAHTYNDDLPGGPLRDPYLLNEAGEVIDMREGRAAYDRELVGEPGDVMARVQIPAIDVDLPIYHGTEDEVLKRGVGHLYGSSLPVGGAGTHSVLTAHSGLPSATLFTNLNKVEVGDAFSVTVLGETLYYEVDQIVVVEPDVGDELRQIPGEDHVTLITCTPTGVNTHRLLVRGVRVEGSAADVAELTGTSFDANAADPGFPWWSVLALAAGTGTYLLLRPRRRASGQEPGTGVTP